MKHTIATSILTLTLALSAHAGPEAWLQSGLIKPEIIEQIKPELQLTADQETKMTAIIAEARTKSEPIERALKELQQTMQDMLRQLATTADAASAHLTKVLESEAAIKQLQLRTLIALRDVLTPEQQKKAQTLSAPKVAAHSDLESQVKAKADKLKAAVDALGEKPTEAMLYRGGEIEKLIKSGDMKAAEAALDALIVESGVNDPEDNSPAPDFAKLEPGNTDLDALRERFESVKERAQEIINIPLMRRMLKAKEAFETAKAAEDATAVGRILTYAEQQVPKP